MPCKRFRRAILKCRECRPEAKTTSMSVKTKTMYIKTKALIDKFAALFCVFQTFCVSLYPNQEITSKNYVRKVYQKGNT
jgi:hypothetical protein